MEAGTVRAHLTAAAAGALLGLLLVAAPAQADAGSPTPASEVGCAAVPLPGPPGPFDELDEAAQDYADRCLEQLAGYPLPARADADAECNERPFLVPGCATEALLRCGTIPVGVEVLCDPARDTTVWLNASAFHGYCLDCAPDLDTRVHHEDPYRQSASGRLTVGLYVCSGEAGTAPGGPGPAPQAHAGGSCPPLGALP